MFILLVILIASVLDNLLGSVSLIVLMAGNEEFVTRSNNHRLYLFPFARKPHGLNERSAKGILGTTHILGSFYLEGRPFVFAMIGMLMKKP